tara:strand:+ start:1397 stop:1720 length:324 start_codon:yes stop_codon:yes gene_type:complete
MRTGIYANVDHFEGSFYGVSAKVELNMRTRVAMVHLNGAPLGGRVSGLGWLKDAESEQGVVILEHGFENRLKRRMITIKSARLDRKEHTVTVSVKIPVVGTVEMTLT